MYILGLSDSDNNAIMIVTSDYSWLWILSRYVVGLCGLKTEEQGICWVLSMLMTTDNIYDGSSTMYACTSL